MTRKKLFKSLNQLCKDLDYEYNINSGGCCFVAAVIAELLENYNIPFKIVHYELNGRHYAIKVSDRYLNRADYKKDEIFECFCGTSEELFDLYYNVYWNRIYNKRWNLIVKTKIKALFRKYENSRT